MKRREYRVIECKGKSSVDSEELPCNWNSYAFVWMEESADWTKTKIAGSAGCNQVPRHDAGTCAEVRNAPDAKVPTYLPMHWMTGSNRLEKLSRAVMSASHSSHACCLMCSLQFSSLYDTSSQYWRSSRRPSCKVFVVTRNTNISFEARLFRCLVAYYTANVSDGSLVDCNIAGNGSVWE